MSSSGLSGKYDTLYDIDSGIHLADKDASMTLVPEVYGTRRIGVAIIGVGRMGSIHLDNMLRQPRANLLYVVDASQARLDFMNKKYFLQDRGVKTISLDNWNTVVEDDKVEALIISTPTFSHEKYVRDGLEHNKHILCEKPLAESADEVRSLVDLAQAKQLKLVCAFNRRYDPSLRRIHDQLRRGDIGQLRLIKTCSRDSPSPPIAYLKTSPGIFHDCMVHDVDMIIWLAKELPVEVHVYATSFSDDYKEMGEYDTVLASMKFKSGLMSVTDLSRVSAAGYDQRVEIFGPLGVLKLDELTLVDYEKHTEIGVTRPNNCYTTASRYLKAYQNEIVELFNHIEGLTTLEPNNIWYLNALCKILNACGESARNGQSVKLEWSGDELSRPL